MNEEQKIRYSRQLFLPDIKEEGQERLLNANILIVGMGGLGCAAAYYLAAAGVGTLWISDNELVELSNLQRQILYATEDVGILKTKAAKKHLLALNPTISIHTIQGLPSHSMPEDFQEALSKADVILDCSDNFETRFALNDLCVKNKIPLISGSALGWQGQVALFPLNKNESACYECLYPRQENQITQAERCEDNGVIGPLVGIIGNMQALAAIKLLLEIENIGTGKLYCLNAHELSWKTRNIEKENAHDKYPPG